MMDQRANRTCRRIGWLLAGAVVVGGIAKPSSAKTPRNAPGRAQDYRPVVLVRPFSYAGPAERSWLAAACRELIIWKLQRSGAVDCYDSFDTDELIDRLGGRGSKRRAVTVKMLAEAVGAKHVIQGKCSYEVIDDVARLTVVSPDAAPVVLPAVRDSSLMTWCNAVADAAAKALKLPKREVADDWPTDSPAAWEYYAQARQALKRQKVREAYGLIVNNALGRDGKFRLAHRLRGHILAGMGDWDGAGSATGEYLRLSTRADDPVDRVAALHNMALICIQRDLMDVARKFLEEALDQAKQLGNGSDALAESIELGRFYLTRSAKASREAAEAESKAEGARKEDDAAEAGKQSARAARRREAAKHHLKAARARFAQALELARRIHSNIAAQQVHNQIGVLNVLKDDLPEAAKSFRRALEIAKRIDDRYGQAVALHQLGQVAQKQKDYQVALKYYRQSLRIAESQGTEQEAVATYSNLALVLAELRQFEEALEIQHKGLELSLKNHMAAGRLGEGASYANLGSIYEAQGRYEEAMQAYESAKEAFVKIGHPRAARMQRRIAELEKRIAH